MPVLGMVGVANTCLGSRTSSWALQLQNQDRASHMNSLSKGLLEIDLQENLIGHFSECS